MSSNILHLSPEVIAAWPPPDYEHPVRKTWMPVYASIWLAFGTVMVALRFGLRLRGHALGLDDVMLLPAWLAGLMFTIVAMLYTQWAQGDRHVWDVTRDKRQYAVLCMWLGQFSFLVCGGCTKVSILLFHRRIVGIVSRRWAWLVWIAIGFTIAYTTAFCIMLLANCTPTEAYWRAFDFWYASEGDYICVHTSSINAISGVCAVVSDLYAVVLPCVMLQHHTLPRNQKIAMNIIFGCGLIVVLAGCIRTYWLIKTGYSSDVTRFAFEVFVWGQFELQAGIMCASAPALRTLFKRHFGGFLASRNDRTGTQRSTIDSLQDTNITIDSSTPIEKPAMCKQTPVARYMSEDGTSYEQDVFPNFGRVNQLNSRG